MIDPTLAGDDPDYLIDCLAMLKAIVSQMARFENRLNDTERGLIDAAVNAVWNDRGRDGTVDAVMDALRSAGHAMADDLATAMLPFSKAGTFGQFFLGDTNLDLSAGGRLFGSWLNTRSTVVQPAANESALM